MIDTIKIVIRMPNPLRCNADFKPRLDSIQEGYLGYFKATANPSARDKKLDKYLPRLTYTQRPKTGYSSTYELAIELSLPKLIFKENFSELTESDFNLVVKRLQESLKEMGIWLFTQQIENADVRAVHYSKNFVFKDYTSCSSILQILKTADISKAYDIQNTTFRNGGYVMHIHTNSLDIAIYDKLADLEQSKKSEKRSIEKDNYVQLDLLDILKRQNPVSVMRYEVRLNSKAKISSSLKGVGFDEDLVFKRIFSSDLSKKILTYHWDNFYSSIPKVALDSNEPQKLLANILQSSGLKGPRQAVAELGMMLLLKDSEQRYVRTLLEERFGKHAWSRLKPLIKKPERKQLKSLIWVSNAIKEFEPTRIKEIEDAL